MESLPTPDGPEMTINSGLGLWGSKGVVMDVFYQLFDFTSCKPENCGKLTRLQRKAASLGICFSNSD
jgi:hypothetical protein